jgi:hypothetical protein
MPTAVTEPGTTTEAPRYHTGATGCGYRYASPAHAWTCEDAPLPALAAVTAPLAKPPPDPEATAARRARAYAYERTLALATTASGRERIRRWCNAGDVTVSARGRIGDAALRAYADAHQVVTTG